MGWVEDLAGLSRSLSIALSPTLGLFGRQSTLSQRLKGIILSIARLRHPKLAGPRVTV